MFTQEELVEKLDAIRWQPLTIKTDSGEITIVCPGNEAYKSACTVTIYLLYYEHELLKVCNSLVELMNYLNTIDYWITIEKYTKDYLHELQQRIDKDNYQVLKHFLTR